MQQEIEVKFLDIEIDAVRRKLKALGAHCEQPMRLMRRAVIDYPDRRLQVQNDAWIRVRDEGNKVTLTYKQTTEHEFGGAKEIETTVGDYQKTIDVFTAIGLTVHTSQETKRETWLLEDVEIVIDEWPWIPPLIEIEGSNHEAVQKIAKMLGLDWNEAVFGTAIVAYEHHYPKAKDVGVRLSQELVAAFDLPVPKWLAEGDA